MTTTKKMDAAVLRIAQSIGIETLDESARRYWHEVPMWDLKKALEAAYHAGQQDGSGNESAEQEKDTRCLIKALKKIHSYVSSASEESGSAESHIDIRRIAERALNDVWGRR
jgi:hypothetical protein